MSLGRLRRGEQVAIVGLVLLVVSLFLRWFDIDRISAPSGGSASFSVFGSTQHGWGYLGHPWIELLVVAAVAVIVAIAFAARAGAGRPTFGAVISVVVGVGVAALVLLLTVLRVLVFTPSPRVTDLGSGSIISTLATTDSATDLSQAEAHLSPAFGAWIGLLALVLLLVGSWIAMADDRSGAAESAVVPPAPREVPPLRPATPAPRPVAEDPGAVDPGPPADAADAATDSADRAR
ncbi:hypothetical protein AB0L40_04735 [Patulibacter sp. NPDC049589]|uniref:hypothetical protein n=1 Tax=Patulibacter sp. NPDC049589 TaxID=3154731 RepID=UPI00342C927D